MERNANDLHRSLKSSGEGSVENIVMRDGAIHEEVPASCENGPIDAAIGSEKKEDGTSTETEEDTLHLLFSSQSKEAERFLCHHCKSEFVPKFHHQLYCSAKCRKAAQCRTYRNNESEERKRKRLDRRNLARNARRLGLSVDQYLKRKDEHAKKPKEVDPMQYVLETLAVEDRDKRYRMSKKWTPEQRRLAKKIYLAELNRNRISQLD